MSKKRIIAHFMHEDERNAAMNMMTNVEATESFLIGDVDENNIPAMRNKRIIIQSLDSPPAVETPGGSSEPLPGIERSILRSSTLSERAPPPVSGTEGLVDVERPNFYVIQLNGPLLENWRNQLALKGVRLLEYFPRFSYSAKLTANQVADIKNLPFVASVRLYGQQDTGPVALKTAAAPKPPSTSPISGQRRMLIYDLRLHSEQDLQEVLQWLQQRDIVIAGTGKRKIRFYLTEDDQRANEIAALPEVQKIEEYVPPKLHNDMGRVILGIDSSGGGGNPATNIDQTGDGQIVGVADTGLDKDHPDFQGRIVGVVALGRPTDSSDPQGHGTHVSGSILGDGSASNKNIKGTAPSAKLFFQSLLDAEGGLGGLPVDLNELFEEAYQAGARIHNNSWGAATNSFYTVNSIEVDDFVARRRDMLIVISAGNEGQAANYKSSQKGYVDWLSIGSPGSCKNALTVGASRSSRTDYGYSGFSYGEAWPDEFPDPPIAREKVSGDAESMAAFSSRGPCDDRRIKPDVVAPGTDIVSTKSSLAPLRNFWGPFPGNSKYAVMGGTSMSAPLVSGCSALVREYFVKNRSHTPSAALIKAALINGTKWLIGPDSQADFASMPNFHQGFGCVNMPTTIPNQTIPNFKLEFIDSMDNPNFQFRQTGQRFRFIVNVAGGPWLRVCLAWTDPAARALQNNLNLFVQDLQSGQKWMGNENLPLGLHIPDPDNNVEVVRLLNPVAGKYMIQVTATNLLQTPQDFALVVGGELSSQLQFTP
jgi:serine protease AprX